MSLSSVGAVERSVHKTNEWLADLAAELGGDDRDQAWRVLRAFLHTLRDRLTVDEAAQLAAQLPLVLRGAFFEGFDPSRMPEKLRDRDAFLTRVAEIAQLAGPTEASLAVEAATRVMASHLGRGEFEHALGQLPHSIRAVLEPH